MKRFFFAGLLIWLPLVVTIWVIRFIIVSMDSLLCLLPLEWQPKQLLGFDIPGLGVILTLVILFITGLLVRNFIGQKLVALWESLLKRIPVVNSIYTSVKQVSDTLFSSSGEAFRKAVLIPYPGLPFKTIAFVTGKPSHKIAAALDTPDDYISVFVPTTPNPTSGFFLFVRTQDVQELPISVDEALKMLLSMGVVNTDSPDQQAHLLQPVLSSNEAPPHADKKE